MNDFLINVAAGVFLSFVTWLLFTAIMPKFRAWLYKAPPLEGKWQYYDGFDTTGDPVGTAVVKQNGEDVTFEATRTRNRIGQIYSRTFRFEGRVRTSQVQLSFEETTSNGFICGNLVLKVSSNQKTLTGFTVYLDHDEGKVVANPIIFKRV